MPSDADDTFCPSPDFAGRSCEVVNTQWTPGVSERADPSLLRYLGARARFLDVHSTYVLVIGPGQIGNGHPCVWKSGKSLPRLTKIYRGFADGRLRAIQRTEILEPVAVSTV